MSVVCWPDWGCAPPPHAHYAYEYRTGPDGDMHAGEVLATVTGRDPARPDTRREYEVLRCHLCINIHVWPLPSAPALASYYAERFYENVHPDMVAHYEEDAAWWAACMHGPLLDTAVACLMPSTKMPAILDIGAGPGLLLREAQRRGWATMAVEPSPTCAARLQSAGHAVWSGSLEDFMQSASRASYDIVTMWETLEHLPYPEKTLLMVADLLRPGGALAIVVPNDYTAAQLTARERFHLPPWWLAPPDHVNYFSPKTLQLLVRRCGFTQRHMRMTFPMIEHFLLGQGRNYVGNPALGRRCHHERVAHELALAQAGHWQEVEAEYVANVATRTGREIVMVATRT